jgi:hypothetical protein
VLIPLSALVFKTLNLTWEQFWQAVTAPRVVASYRLTFGASFIAALVNAVFRLAGGLGAGALPVLWQKSRRRLGGLALRLAHRRGRHFTDSAAGRQRMDWPVLWSPWAFNWPSTAMGC